MPGDTTRMLREQAVFIPRCGSAKPARGQVTGKYDFSLSWTGDAPATPHNHVEGAGGYPGGAGYGEHGGAAAAPAGDDSSGLTLSEALQSQLGLKLVAAEKSVARIFVVDRIEKAPTAN